MVQNWWAIIGAVALAVIAGVESVDSDNVVRVCPANNRELRRKAVNVDRLSTPENNENPHQSEGFRGAQTESRTRDLRITSALLYQLSYLGNVSHPEERRKEVIGRLGE